MKLLQLLVLSLFKLQGSLGLTITNTISNSRPRLGETITLSCSIAGGTASQVEWWKDRHHSTGTVFLSYNCLVSAKEYKTRFRNVQCDANNFNFQLSNVQISDSGEWECEANGEDATTKLRLDVLVPPLTPTVTNPSPVIVGETAKFTCKAENENVTKPVTYTWTKNGDTLSPGTIEPGALLFSSVKKNNAGIYACVAKNDAGSKKSTEQDFVVYYAPNALQLKTTTASNSKSEGETETFTCEAIGGHPVPSVRLIRQEGAARETLIEENNRVVKFRRQMMRQDNQVKFYCNATGPGIPNNMLSRMITYNVLFPHDVQVKTSKTTVNEHEFVRFECATSGGNPELVTRYQWLWKKSGSTAEQVIQDTETSTKNGKVLEFTRIQYDKSGRYTCKVWNDGGMGQASTLLNVQFSPRIDPEAKMKYVVAGELGKEASFELFIIANPTPATTGYVWSKDGNVLSNSSKDYETVSWRTFSRLIIKNVKSSDFTNYACSVKTSGFQAQVFKFKLLQQGPPSAPRELKVINKTAVAATLSWISESNGGYEQRSYVQYKKSAESWDFASEVPQGGIPDPGLKKRVYHKVTDLESNVWYEFRVRSKNSHAGPHTSDFSNIVSGKTPEKPRTSLVGVTRIGNLVTVRWEPVTGNHTELKIRYCQIGTEDCMKYAVPKPEDNYASFLVDADKTYYYEMIIEDGGDVVYRSRVIKDEVDDKTNIVFAAVGGAGIVAIIGIIVAVVLWRRGHRRKRQSRRPAEDTANDDDTRIGANQRPASDMADYDDIGIELTTAGHDSVAIYANIGTEYVNDVPRPEGTISQTPAQPMVTGRHVAVHGVRGDEPTYQNVDGDVYDYVDSPSTRQQGVSGQNTVPEPPENETERAAAEEKHEQNLSSEERGEQAVQEPEATHSELAEAEPGKDTAESSCSQTNGAHGQTPSGSDDNTARDQDSPYEQLGPVAPVKHGEYLDLRHLSSE